MYWIIGLLALGFLSSLVRMRFLRAELRRLGERIDALPDRAKHGARLFLDGGDGEIARIANSVNALVDEYENRVRRAEKLEESIRLSISGISHDLRTPLTALSGYLQLLGKTEASQKRNEYMALIEDSARTLSDLAENFYDLSRLELGDDIFVRRRIEFESFVCERFLAFYEDFAARGLAVEMGDPELRHEVAVDPVALTRVLNNLIQNILRYASGTVSVAFAAENGCAAVRVGNETAGALPDEADEIFDRFYTTGRDGSNRGAGLGLYVSKKLVEGMGGGMRAEKIGDKAIAITIVFPKRPGAQGEPAVAARRENEVWNFL